MAVIKTTFGEGGANLSPRGQGQPSLATALRDAADDFSGMQSADIASADAATLVIASADASDLATAITLVNEIKTALNAQTDIFTLGNEIKAALNAIAASGYTIKTTKG